MIKIYLKNNFMVMAIPSIKTRISPILFQRLSSIILIYAGALSLNALYIQSIGSGIGIYSGLFHVTFISQVLYFFLFLIGALILIVRPSIKTSQKEKSQNTDIAKKFFFHLKFKFISFILNSITITKKNKILFFGQRPHFHFLKMKKKFFLILFLCPLSSVLCPLKRQMQRGFFCFAQRVGICHYNFKKFIRYINFLKLKSIYFTGITLLFISNLKNKILNGFIILFYSLNEFNSYLVVRFISKFSILVLLLQNQGIINLYSKELLYLFLLLSIILLFYILIISLINIIICLKKKKESASHGNNSFNLIIKIIGIIFLLNKIYFNYSEYIFFYDIFLYLLFYCLFSLIITKFKVFFCAPFLRTKSVLFYKRNIFNLFSTSQMMSANNLSNVNILENKDKLLNVKDNIDIKSDSSGNTTNIGVNINAEDMVKKGVEGISTAIEKGVVQAASQKGLAGSIGAGLTAGATFSKGQSPRSRITTTVGLVIAGGAIHVTGSAVNRALTIFTLDKNKIDNNNDNPPSPKNDFINSPLEEMDLYHNPVETLLYGIWILNFIILIFLFLLLFTYISKIIVSLDYKLNWLDKIFSPEKSIKIRSLLLKFLKTFSWIRDFNIIMLIIALIFISLCNLYFYSVFCFNLEAMCNLYLKIYTEGKK